MPPDSRPSPLPAPAKSAHGCTLMPAGGTSASSSKWAARIRQSSWPTPISTPPARTWSTQPSSPLARNAPPPAAPSSKTPSTKSSSPPWWSELANSRSATACSPVSRSAPASISPRWRPSSAKSRSAAGNAESPPAEAAASPKAGWPTAGSSSPPSSPASPRPTLSRVKRSSDPCSPSCAPPISRTPCASPTPSRSGSPPPSRPPTSRAPSTSSIAPKPACSPSICPARAWNTNSPSAAPRIPASVPRNRVRPRSNFIAITKPSILNIRMRLGQTLVNGAVTAARFEIGGARLIPGHSALDVILDPSLERGASLPVTGAEPIIPIFPPEVWGCGCTYETSAAFRDAEHGAREGMYAHVYRDARPEVFFKGTARHCVGSGEAIGIRPDSRFTAPEPELALVLGPAHSIFGFTLANDVSAWDIERENALYLTQSKVYDRCCALGPVIITAVDIPDPYSLQMTCTVTRSGKVLSQGEVSTGNLHRRLETLLESLPRANHVPAGAVVLTGTGIIVPQEAALAPGDVVTISVPEIGDLTNTVSIVS